MIFAEFAPKKKKNIEKFIYSEVWCMWANCVSSIKIVKKEEYV